MTNYQPRFGHVLMRRSKGGLIAAAMNFDTLIDYLNRHAELGEPYKRDKTGAYVWQEGDIVIVSCQWLDGAPDG